MAKDSDSKRGGLSAEETGGAVSGLLAEEDEFDRRTLWRLGTWAVASVGAVVVALVVNQSSIGLRHEQTASADLLKQAQQLQLAARDGQNETRRLASAVDTLNSDRDRLYARVAVLEQGLDSVTGTIARQAPSPPPQTNSSPAKTSQTSTSAAAPANATVPPAASPPAPSPATTASATPAVTTSAVTTSAPAATATVEPAPAAAKPTPPAPVVAPVAVTAPIVPDKTAAEKQDKHEKQDKKASTAPAAEPVAAAKPISAQQSASVQPSGSLMVAKSMMAPPDPAAGKLIEPVSPPKTVTSAPMPEVAAVVPKASDEKASEEKEADAAPELAARHTEFGVDVGGANSVPGLRALWRGLLKSRSNAALTSLRPIIVIKESNSGLGMQLRLVAGPINDAAAAAKICASLTVSERGCSTTVFEGQRLTMGADEQPKANTRTSSETKPADTKPETDSKPKYYGHRRYVPKHQAKEDDPPPPPPKEEPSTLSLIFGSH